MFSCLTLQIYLGNFTITSNVIIVHNKWESAKYVESVFQSKRLLFKLYYMNRKMLTMALRSVNKSLPKSENLIHVTDFW